MLREKIPVRSYHGEAFRTNRTNKKHLSEDFSHRCAYCNDHHAYGGGYRAYQVEHFAPKSKFPDLKYNYDNLLYACPWCNGAKWDLWPSEDAKANVVGEIGFIDPCTNEYDNHLERLSDGSIKGKTSLGNYMVKTLRLYLKRHAIVYNMDKIKVKISELSKSIEQDRAKGENCAAKEKALQLIEHDFVDYFKLWESESDR